MLKKTKKRKVKKIVTETPVISPSIEPTENFKIPIVNPRIVQLKEEIKHLEPLAATDAKSQYLLGRKKSELSLLQAQKKID